MAEIDDLLGSLLAGDEKGEQKGMDTDIFEMLLKIMPLIDTVNKENDDERLLKALMPYMGDERRGKIGTAQSILKIAKILPMLGNLFQGGGE